MADIKTRDVTRGHIKTLDRAASSMAGYDMTISNCGIISHITCQAGAGNVHIIDYERYINGETSYEVESSWIRKHKIKRVTDMEKSSKRGCSKTSVQSRNSSSGCATKLIPSRKGLSYHHTMRTCLTRSLK